MGTRAVLLGCAVSLVGGSRPGADGPKLDLDKLPPPAAGQMHFANDVLPILERSCLRCHNSQRRGQAGVYRHRFRFDAGRDAAMEFEGVIVPGKSDASRLIHHVCWLYDPMPPREEDRLSARDVGKLRAWIDQGAVWHGHTHTLPAGYRQVNVLVAAEFPADGGEKRWAEFAEKHRRPGFQAALAVADRKGKMLLSGAPPETGRGWRPFIPSNNPKVRVFLPDVADAEVQVRVRDVKVNPTWVVKDGRLVWADFAGALVWSHTGSGAGVLSSEFEVGYDGYPVLDVRVHPTKDGPAGVSNVLILAPTTAAKK